MKLFCDESEDDQWLVHIVSVTMFPKDVLRQSWATAIFILMIFILKFFSPEKRSPGNSSSGHILKGGGRLRSKILGFQLLISVAESSDRHFCLTGHQEFEKTHTHLQLLGIFTGPMCLWGPVYGSRCLSVTHVFETLLMWLWLMMIPTQYYWWCQC